MKHGFVHIAEKTKQGKIFSVTNVRKNWQMKPIELTMLIDVNGKGGEFVIMPETAKVIKLKGNPKNPESAEHIIQFPGGSISVCRTSDNKYWVHMEVNRHQIIKEANRESMLGEIIDSRLDYDRPPGDVRKIDIQDLKHVAIQITTRE